MFLFFQDGGDGIIQYRLEILKGCTFVTRRNSVQYLTGRDWIGIPGHFPHLLSVTFVADGGRFGVHKHYRNRIYAKHKLYQFLKHSYLKHVVRHYVVSGSAVAIHCRDFGCFL